MIGETLFWLMIAATVGHAAWALIEQPANVGGVALNMPSYLLPVAVFAWARKELGKEAPKWGTADTVVGGLFACSAVAMVVLTTVFGALNKHGFSSVYVNAPLVFLVPLTLFGVVWRMVRSKPDGNCSKVGKVLYALPLLPMVGMAIHCTAQFIHDIPAPGEFPSSSAPWWLMTVAFAVLYLLGMLLLCGVYGIYRLAARKKRV